MPYDSFSSIREAEEATIQWVNFLKNFIADVNLFEGSFGENCSSPSSKSGSEVSFSALTAICGSFLSRRGSLRQLSCNLSEDGTS